MAEENVKVAVRVRPFNSREKTRNAELIVEMKGSTTYIRDPENPGAEPKSFNFDHSYWSHDGCKEDGNGFFGPDSSHPNGKIFCDQKRVFNELGVSVYNNAWEGFNSTLFAYGQTGSGKSWSVVGYGVNKGIVPQFAEKLFQGIDEKKDSGIVFEVTFSMLEIYMEEVRDLLDNKPKAKGGLRIRQHPKKGFYAEQLQYATVASYADIEAKMEQGTMNRTVASTNMNATSSRAHTIVGISFIQKSKNSAGEETAKSSVVNLVDLAGSERAESTGATGDRLKEGAAINQSLSSLGNVIAALADRSEGKNVKIPYRDSVLTKLLMNALGGNSKTVMIAAISPADINYEESLSTLRYADRAKQIKTKATVNEDPTEKLIRELQEENEKLKKMLASGGVQLPQGDGETAIEETDDMTDAEKKALRKQLEEEYKAQMEENEREMEEMKKSYEEKLRQAQEIDGGMTEKLQAQHIKEAKDPYITNVNYDPMLSNRIVHFVDLQREVVGKKCKDGEEKYDIPLVGPSIQDDHAVFTRDGDKVFIEKINPQGRLIHNGIPLVAKTELKHNDRLIFGTTNYFVFCFPHHEGGDMTNITYEMMQDELSEKAGFDLDKSNKSKDELLLQEDIADILPGIEEANSISAELDKKKKFEMVMVSPEARGEVTGRTEIYVRVVDLETGLEWMWSRDEFFNKRFVMQEMFNKKEDEEDWKLPKDQDPFEVDPNMDVLIGTTKIFPQSLAYMVETKNQLEVIDYKGVEVGRVNIEIVPCDPKGKEYTENDDIFVESPSELLNKELHFVAKILNGRGLPKRFTDIYAKFVFYMDKKFYCSNPVKNTQNPDWNFKQQFDFKPVTQDLLDYLQSGAVILQIRGKQKLPKEKKTVNTQDALNKEALAKGQIGAGGAAGSAGKVVDPEKMKYIIESATAEQRVKKAETRLNQVKKLVELAEGGKHKKINTQVLKDLVYAPSRDEAENVLKMAFKSKKGREDDSSSSSDSESSDSESEKKSIKSCGSEESIKKKEKPKSAKAKAGKPQEKQSSGMCLLL